eukprot:2878861-Pyramimonas_sp.AAC.1
MQELTIDDDVDKIDLGMSLDSSTVLAREAPRAEHHAAVASSNDMRVDVKDVKPRTQAFETLEDHEADSSSLKPPLRFPGGTESSEASSAVDVRWGTVGVSGDVTGLLSKTGADLGLLEDSKDEEDVKPRVQAAEVVADDKPNRSSLKTPN